MNAFLPHTSVRGILCARPLQRVYSRHYYLKPRTTCSRYQYQSILGYPNRHDLLSHKTWKESKNLETSRLFSVNRPDDNNNDDLSISSSHHLDYTSTRFREKQEAESFFNDAERDANCISYPKGIPEGFYVVQQYSVPPEGFQNFMSDILDEQETKNDCENEENNDHEGVSGGITQQEINRLNVDAQNMTLPLALMLLDRDEYPSLSRARKSCRKGYIVIHRGPLHINENTGVAEFDTDKCIRGRVGDRVFPGDVIGRQVRMHGGFYPGFESTKPPFDLPVVYEDDHFAIVNKPAGVVVYSQRKQGHGMLSVRAALPYVLKPPKRGTLSIIRRPVSVHRLDKPTCGLLLIAKTKPAMVHLTRQFVERKVKKTYTAIVNGIPSEPLNTSLSLEEARTLGVDVEDSLGKKEMHSHSWQLIDCSLDEKSAVTVWRPLKYVNSLKAKDGVLTLVELKPKTGRYHQLRRHMALVKNCPIVGDTIYDGGDASAMSLRGRGLFLCSNRVILEHPYYNSPEGRREWESLPESEKWADGAIFLSNDDGHTVHVRASIDLPNKFDSFLTSEGDRYEKLGNKEM